MMQRKKRKLSLVLFIALMLLFSVPLTVMAASDPPGPDYVLDSNIDQAITIGRCSNANCEHKITGGEWNHSIKVTEGSHTIIFEDDEKIIPNGAANDAPAFEVASGATVTLVVNKGKTVELDSRQSTGAGLSVQSGGNLYIQGEGTLKTFGATGGAGIGGSANPAGNITIQGGTIEATGGAGASGIGSGKGGTSGHQSITIEGGNITATGGDGGEDVEADGTRHPFTGGPGIGYPQSVGDVASSTKGDVTISGGNITAIGGKETSTSTVKVTGIP